MWNRHPVVRQEKLARETDNNVRSGKLRKIIEDNQTFWGTRQDVKRATGELPVTGEELTED